jgi:hypothetical protein
MKQPTIAKKQKKGSHVAVQWLMRLIATDAPRTTGMTNNTIKKHLVLHLCEDILDHGVPDNVNSAYPESAHIPLAKITSRNTQKRVLRYIVLQLRKIATYCIGVKKYCIILHCHTRVLQYIVLRINYIAIY